LVNIAKRLIIALLVIFVPVTNAWAQRQISFLRDAETEHFLHDITDPILKAAGLKPEAVHIYLVHDNSINAFVAGGENIFIHTGLILAAHDVDELTGVIAHETCHIACGHQVRDEGYQTAGTTSILSMVLGAAAILAGGGDAGMGIMMAGQQMAQGQALAYSRGQESEADLAAAKYLRAVGVSGSGLIRFFQKLQREEALAQVKQDPFVRDHPLNRTRILQLQQAVETSPYYHTPPNPKTNAEFLKVKAKLAGYLYDPVQTLRIYPPSDTSAPARYARVYAYHKALEWDKAIKEADALIAEDPTDPYYYEIKGQILFENGHVQKSLPVFKKAVSLKPYEPLIATAYGQALVSLEDDAHMKQAIPILQKATKMDSENTFGWFNLARAYSWIGNEPEASLATAERFYAGGAPAQAAMHAERAMRGLKMGTPDWLRAQDIMLISQEAASKMKRRGHRG